MAAPGAIQGSFVGQASLPHFGPLRGNKIRDFFFDLGRIIYPERDYNDPIPALTVWSWVNPRLYSSNREINFIYPGNMSDPVMAIYSFWGKLDAIVLRYFPNPKSRYNLVTVYAISDRFAEIESKVYHNSFTRFEVTRILSPDDQITLKKFAFSELRKEKK